MQIPKMMFPCNKLDSDQKLAFDAFVFLGAQRIYDLTFTDTVIVNTGHIACAHESEGFHSVLKVNGELFICAIHWEVAQEAVDFASKTEGEIARILDNLRSMKPVMDINLN